MKKRLFCTLLVAVLAFGLFVPAGIAQSNEPVTLRFMWWGGDTRHAATLKAIDGIVNCTQMSPSMPSIRDTMGISKKS